MKLLLIVLVCITSSQSINKDALEKCTENSAGDEGVTCDNTCRSSLFWCNNVNPVYCENIKAMTNDKDLCLDYDFWKQISCNVTRDGKVNAGKRCTGCTTGKNNYCFYPNSQFEELDNPVFPTTCDCVTTASSSITTTTTDSSKASSTGSSTVITMVITIIFTSAIFPWEEDWEEIIILLL